MPLARRTVQNLLATKSRKGPQGDCRRLLVATAEVEHPMSATPSPEQHDAPPHVAPALGSVAIGVGYFCFLAWLLSLHNDQWWPTLRATSLHGALFSAVMAGLWLLGNWPWSQPADEARLNHSQVSLAGIFGVTALAAICISFVTQMVGSILGARRFPCGKRCSLRPCITALPCRLPRCWVSACGGSVRSSSAGASGMVARPMNWSDAQFQSESDLASSCASSSRRKPMKTVLSGGQFFVTAFSRAVANWSMESRP